MSERAITTRVVEIRKSGYDHNRSAKHKKVLKRRDLLKRCMNTYEPCALKTEVPLDSTGSSNFESAGPIFKRSFQSYVR